MNVCSSTTENGLAWTCSSTYALAWGRLRIGLVRAIYKQSLTADGQTSTPNNRHRVVVRPHSLHPEMGGVEFNIGVAKITGTRKIL